MRDKDKDRQREEKKEKRMGIEDSKVEASSVHFSHVIELIGTKTVFHFLSFVAHLDKWIQIKCFNIIIPHLKSFKLLIEG